MSDLVVASSLRLSARLFVTGELAFPQAVGVGSVARLASILDAPPSYMSSYMSMGCCARLYRAPSGLELLTSALRQALGLRSDLDRVRDALRGNTAIDLLLTQVDFAGTGSCLSSELNRFMVSQGNSLELRHDGFLIGLCEIWVPGVLVVGRDVLERHAWQAFWAGGGSAAPRLLSVAAHGPASRTHKPPELSRSRDGERLLRGFPARAKLGARHYADLDEVRRCPLAHERTVIHQIDQSSRSCHANLGQDPRHRTKFKPDYRLGIRRWANVRMSSSSGHSDSLQTPNVDSCASRSSVAASRSR